jgi:hypothetical protein
MSGRAFSQLLIAAAVVLASLGAFLLWKPGLFIVAAVCLAGGLLVNVEDGEREGNRVVRRAP